MNKNKMLESMLNHAVNSVPYYMDLKNKENISLIDFPIINKQMINNQYKSFISNKFDDFSDNIAIMPTSGSTGVYLKVLWLKTDRISSDCSTWKMRNRWYGITPEHKWLSFHSELYSGNRISNVDLERDYIISKNLMSINMKLLYTQDYNKIINLINEHKPTWVLGFPSILNNLATFAINNNIFFNELNYIECMGEILFPNILSNLKKAFYKSHVANMYGTTETGVIALECPYGNMHILKQNCFVELKKDKSILLTSLKNKIMPFIRYEIGDIASLNNIKCECGYDSPCIENLQGRNNDFVILNNENRISAMSLTRIFELINDEYLDSIKTFSIIQEKYDYFIINVEISTQYNGWENAITEKIKHRFYEIIEQKVNIDVIISNKQLFHSNHSKYKFFISKIEKGGNKYE